MRPGQLIIDPDDPSAIDEWQRVREAEVGKSVFEKLETTYTGYHWRVDVPHNQGLLKIMLPEFTGKVWGYVLPFSVIDSDPSLKCVVRGGGELLERFGLDRKSYNDAQLSDALDLFGRTPPSIRDGFELGEKPTSLRL